MIPSILKEKLISEYDNEVYNTIEQGYIKKPLTIRINTIKTTKEEIIEILNKNNIKYQTISWFDNALIILNRDENELKELNIYKDGKIYYQSLSSQIPPLILDPKENETILDMTAAPGGKTTELAALSNNKAFITSTEKSKIRYDRLKYNIEKQGAKKVTILKEDATNLDDFFKFDKILLDAPCSGSGTIIKDNDNSYLTEEFIGRITNTQKRLIDKAIELLKQNGELVYSTCSILKEEDDEIIKYVLEKYPDLELMPISIKDLPLIEDTIKGTIKIVSTKYYEGFFIAKIKRMK
jgi:NOL1/NOP2/sun family putative RNA methylase